jgi:phosphoribosylamine-glycine ligase
MKMTNDEKKLLGLTRKLENQKCREDLIYQAEAMVRAQEALKADYGLVGPDAPLFNGIGSGAGGKPAA